MPKIITNLREEIISSGRKLLLEDGYSAFTMRAVASACGIALGTVYNYFSSKDMLCAAIMLVDWNSALEGCRRKLSASPECIDGLETVYDSIRGFASIYTSVWSEAGPGSYTGIYHSKLIDGISGIVHSLLSDTACISQPDPSVFISEVLAASATRAEVQFCDIKPFIIKLI